MFKKLSAVLKNKLLLTSLGIFSVGISIGWSALWKESILKIASQQEQEKLEGKKSSVVNRIAHEEKKLAAYQAFFSKSQDASWVIEVINHTADDCGVALSSVTPEYSSAGVDSYRRISLNISTRCTYHQLGVFVSKIESYPSFIKIREIQLSPSAESGPGKKLLEVSMTVNAFFLTGVI